MSLKLAETILGWVNINPAIMGQILSGIEKEKPFYSMTIKQVHLFIKRCNLGFLYEIILSLYDPNMS